MAKKKIAGKAKRKAKPKVKKPVKRAGKTSKPKKHKAVRKAVKSSKKKAPKTLESLLEKIGEVTHYFPHVNAAAVKMLKGGLRVGDQIYIKGHTTDFKEAVPSIQLDHAPINEAKKGQEIGLMVKSRVRIGDSIYRI